MLVGTPGQWTGTPTPALRYEWRRCEGGSCDAIEGADELRYRVQQADEGRTLRLRVIAANSDGSVSEDSDATAEVTPAFVNRSVPTVSVSGPLRVGSRLTASEGSWRYEADDDGVAYGWLRCDAEGDACGEIDGATRSTYVLTSADAGHSLRVRVSVSFPHLPSVRPGVERSAPTGTVAAAELPLPTATTAGTTAVTATSVTLLGAVGPRGSATSWAFEYGPTDRYGSRTPAVTIEGTTVVPVQVTVTGLTPGTVYHYRLVARNAAGETDGDDAEVLTATAAGSNAGTAAPLPSPPGSSAAPRPTAVAAVSSFAVRVDVNVVRLSWVAPTANRRVVVAIVRRTGRKPRGPRDGKVVYRGTAQTALDVPTGLKRVWYAAFVLADGGRASGPAYAALSRFRPSLLAPLEASDVKRRVRFAWTSVKGASYYNLQVWDLKLQRRIAIRWPAGRTMTLSLRPGRYRWYVYPGHGARSKARYGALLGQGSFRVR
jgi:hypothetical protein